jgi:hypothetical protein
MGFSLRPLGRRITDIFDANSAQDQAKRVAAGQAQMYEQQQANKGVAGRSIASNPIQRVVNTGRALGEGIIEAPRQLNNWAVTSMQQGSNDYINAQRAQSNLQNTQAQIAASQGRLLRSPLSTPVQKQNAMRLLNQNSQGMNDVYGSIKEQQTKDLTALDPRRNLAAGASVVFDLATLGVGAGAKTAFKEAAQQGVKQFGKVAFKEGSKATATGAVSGGLSPIVNKGKDATAADIMLGAAGGAALGFITPAGMYGAGRLVNKVTSSGPIPNLLRDKGIMRPSILNDAEVADLARFKELAGTGAMMDDGVYERGLAAAQKAGVDIRPTSPDVDNLIKAHQTYNVRKMQPRGETGGGFLGNEPTIKNPLGEDVPNPNYVAPQATSDGWTRVKNKDGEYVNTKTYDHFDGGTLTKQTKEFKTGGSATKYIANKADGTTREFIRIGDATNYLKKPSKVTAPQVGKTEPTFVRDNNGKWKMDNGSKQTEPSSTKPMSSKVERSSNEGKDLAEFLSESHKTLPKDTEVTIKYQPAGTQTVIPVQGKIKSSYGGKISNDVQTMSYGGKSKTYNSYRADGRTLVTDTFGNTHVINNMDIKSVEVAPQVGKTDKPKVGLKKNEKDLLARVAYKEATDKAAMADAQNTVNKIREKAFKEGNRNLTRNEMIKEALAMEKLTGVKPQSIPQAAQPKPKVIKYPPVGEITEAPKTPGAFQRSVRSIKGVLKQYGETGKDAVKRLENARNNKEISTQAFLDKTKAVWDLDDNETIQFFQALKKLSNGEQPTMSDRVAKAVQEWSDNIPSVRERAVAAGIEVGDQGKFYAPQTHSNLKGDGEIKFINQMIAEGKATDIADARTKLQFMKNDNYKPFGSLEKSREVDMPGYDMTKKALSDYVARAHDTIATAEQFGPKGEGKMEILARLQQEGYNSSQINKAEEYLDKALKLKQYDQTATRASSAVRQANAFMTLGTAGVSNAGQVTNTMTVAGIGRTLKNMAKIATSKTSRAQADSMGVTLDHAISTIESQQVGTQNRILRNIASPLFREVERFNRRYTALVGEDFGNHLLKKGEFGTRKLKELGVTGEIGKKLTPNQIRELSRGLVETTQFKVDPMDLPGWTDSPMGKVVSQYKPFIYKQTEFMYHQVIKEAGRGNFAPLLRFLAVGVFMGLGGQKIKDVIKGRDSFRDDEGNNKSTAALVDKGISSVGGYGMVDNARYLFNKRGSDKLSQYVAGAVGGPTAGNAAEFVDNLAEGLGKNKDWKPMGRDLISKVPTVGPKIANTVLPYDEKVSSTPKKGEEATPAQLDKQASEELKKLRENVKAGDNSLIQLPNGEYAATINGEVKSFKKLADARNAARLDHALADGSDSKVLGEKGKEIYYYKNENGETKAMPNYKHEFDVVDSQNQLDMYVAKDNEDYDGWTSAAKSQIKALETLRDRYNKDSQEDKVDDIQKKIETLKSSMRKYAGYGGSFKKGSGSKVNSGSYRVSLNAGGSAPRVTSKTQVAALRRVSIKGGGTKPRVSSAKSRV